MQQKQGESKEKLDVTIKTYEERMREFQAFHRQMIRDFNFETKVKDTIQKQLKERCTRLEREIKKQTRPYHYPGQLGQLNYSPEGTKENNPNLELGSAIFSKQLNSMKTLPLRDSEVLRP
jgi:hypothetical protein